MHQLCRSALGHGTSGCLVQTLSGQHISMTRSAIKPGVWIKLTAVGCFPAAHAQHVACRIHGD
ncbi:hypothetical protein D8B25_07680 [Verminephrobacter aporrectodeae subsp. tuberculatae]|nr:hypothetical protein [Verminephrobacter aporrectodeae subsp. tuberculatae]MCW8202747.1 hypothetical protein [Verminephrobacter aporrectodeae subsp. tuberculatae]